MNVRIVRVISRRPLPRKANEAPSQMVIVELQPPPDAGWLREFYSNDMSRQFGSYPPGMFSISHDKCLYECEVMSEKAVRAGLEAIIAETNRLSECPHERQAVRAQPGAES